MIAKIDDGATPATCAGMAIFGTLLKIFLDRYSEYPVIANNGVQTQNIYCTSGNTYMFYLTFLTKAEWAAKHKADNRIELSLEVEKEHFHEDPDITVDFLSALMELYLDGEYNDDIPLDRIRDWENAVCSRVEVHA